MALGRYVHMMFVDSRRRRLLKPNGFDCMRNHASTSVVRGERADGIVACRLSQSVLRLQSAPTQGKRIIVEGFSWLPGAKSFQGQVLCRHPTEYSAHCKDMRDTTSLQGASLPIFFLLIIQLNRLIFMAVPPQQATSIASFMPCATVLSNCHEIGPYGGGSPHLHRSPNVEEDAAFHGPRRRSAPHLLSHRDNANHQTRLIQLPFVTGLPPTPHHRLK